MMKQVKKRLLALVLAIVMAVGVVPVTATTAKAAGNDTIELHDPVWSNNFSTYQFSNVNVNFSGGGQKIFCLSVDNKGTFVLPSDVKLGGSGTEIKGVQKTGSGLEYVGSVTGGMELSSLTVIGTGITNTEVEAFIKALVFHRNGVAPSAEQKVSVVSNKVDLTGKEMTVMAVDGVIHYYKYVLYAPGNNTSTWYNAYNDAKKDSFQEMKGYLATVTNENEQLYLYGDFNEDEVNKRSVDLRAWIGGARALNAENFFDVNSVTDGAFNPGTGWPYADKWYWMCGPEAGTQFYETDEGGRTKKEAGAVDGAYYGWNDNKGEPNNGWSDYYDKVSKDPYKQEYVLEYGFEAANWNDYSPYNTLRDDMYGIEGYIIEFSPYMITDQNGTPKEEVKEKEPSATDMKVIVVEGVAITANDFILSTEEAKNLNADKAIDAGDVNVTDQSVTVTDPKTVIEVNNDQLKKINEDGKGKYDLEYTYESTGSDKSASETVTVTVVDKTNTGTVNGSDITIGANHFKITLDDAETVAANPYTTEAQNILKKLASPVATDDGQYVPQKDITVKESGIKAENGQYNVTFDYQGVSVTVTATVAGGQMVSKTDITADDFTVVVGNEPLSPDDFKEKANVVAKDENGSDVNVSVDLSDLDELNEAIKKGPAGEYPVKVTTPDGTEKTITVTVIQYPYIAGHNFIISVDDAKDKNKTTAETVKKLADAARVENEEATGDSATISAKAADVSKLNGVTEPGKVPVTFTDSTSPNTAEERTVTATVVDKTQTGLANDNSGVTIVIGANNFCLTIEQAKTIVNDPKGSEAKAIVKKLANAVATADGKEVKREDIDADPSKIVAKKGSYEVTFTYKGQSVTVNATVKDTGAADDKITLPDVNLTANDFTVEVGDPQLLPDAFKKKADVEAKDENGSTVGVTVDLEDLKKVNDAINNGPVGEYTVTVEADGISTEVTVTVVKYPYIAGHDFIISVNDANNADADKVKDLTDATRITKESPDGTKAEIQVENLNDLNNVKEPGTVPVTLKDSATPSADDKPVTATVVDETKAGIANDGSGAEIVIGANNFCLTIEQAKTVATNSPEAKAIVKKLANAVATANGEAVKQEDIETDPSNIKPENGIYKVTFTYKGQTVEVNATVKDEGAADKSTSAATIPDINLTANDFSIPAKSTVLDATPDTTPADTFKDMADVVAKYNNGSSVTEVTPDKDQLTALVNAVNEGKKGEYPVTVTATGEGGKTVMTTVTVTVTDEGADTGEAGAKPQPGDEHIGANNFVIGTDDFPLLTPENVPKLANAEAYEIDTKKDVPVTTVDTSQVENKPGKYPIKLSTDKGTSTTIYVTIDENWKTIGDVDKASDANKKDSSVDQDKAVPTVKPGDTVGADRIYEISNPKDVTQDVDAGREVETVNIAGADLPAGSWTSDGTTLTINSSAMQGKKEGTYPVVVTYKDGSKRTFNITVVAYDERTVVKKVPTFNMQKDIGVGKKFKLNLVGRDANAVPKFKTSNKKIATVDSKGVIKAKKKGKCTITASVIQNGSYYTVKIKLIVKKSMKMYNLKNAALVKQQGILPEFNVYKRVVKGKKTKLKFTNVTKDAKVTYTTSNKKVATISKKGVIKGKKKGFAKITAKIEQNGYTYYTRLFVRVDDGTKNKELKKYLK